MLLARAGEQEAGPEDQIYREHEFRKLLGTNGLEQISLTRKPKIPFVVAVSSHRRQVFVVGIFVCLF